MVLCLRHATHVYTIYSKWNSPKKVYFPSVTLFATGAHTVVWKAVMFSSCDFLLFFISASLISAVSQPIWLKMARWPEVSVVCDRRYQIGANHSNKIFGAKNDKPRSVSTSSELITLERERISARWKLPLNRKKMAYKTRPDLWSLFVNTVSAFTCTSVKITGFFAILSKFSAVTHVKLLRLTNSCVLQV